MASFYAELHVGSHRYRVLHCHYQSYQHTDSRGRVTTKVRYHPLRATVDLLDNDELMSWAATPNKTLDGELVFYNATQLVALETIAFKAAYCVGYQEDFVSGAGGDGSYIFNKGDGDEALIEAVRQNSVYALVDEALLKEKKLALPSFADGEHIFTPLYTHPNMLALAGTAAVPPGLALVRVTWGKHMAGAASRRVVLNPDTDFTAGFEL